MSKKPPWDIFGNGNRSDSFVRHPSECKNQVKMCHWGAWDPIGVHGTPIFLLDKVVGLLCRVWVLNLHKARHPGSTWQ